MREKSLVPAKRTLSNLIWSPMFGAQIPSTTRRSPSVTLHCFPNRCTIAKFLDAFFSIIWLHSAITSFEISETVLFSTGAKFVANLDSIPPVKERNFLITNI